MFIDNGMTENAWLTWKKCWWIAGGMVVAGLLLMLLWLTFFADATAGAQ